MTTATRYDHRVQLPESELDGLRIEHFELSPGVAARESLRAGHGRYLLPGRYTRLLDRGTLWMSDTHGEWRDHMVAVDIIRSPATKRVLINGLGIGMVLRAALACEHIEHVDVVEIDQRVVDLVGPHYADDRLTIHTADALTKTWRPGTRWDAAWHDIWPEIDADNLPQMIKLHRSYGRRVHWQGSWGRDLIERQRQQERRYQAFWE